MLRLELLGGLTITQNNAPVTNFMSGKVPALLAYLAVTKRAHSRDALAALLWGDLPETDAKNNLRQTLSNLKKFFEPHLDITRDTVAFDSREPYSLDVEQFEKIGDRRPDIPISNLESLISVYRGDFLDGFFVRDASEFEEWMLLQRTRLRELALNALHTLTEHHITHGEYQDAKNYAARLLDMDAWREEAHRLLMLCYARTGQRSAALAQYKKCRAILQREFGVEPSAETNVLYERIRAAGETPRHNLARQATSFVGRAQELARVETLLLKPECRLVTILGAGGVGKTRLALHAAEQLLQRGAFLNGVFFVSLVGLESSAQIAPAMADAFGLVLASGEPKTHVADYLREKEILVVLDNVEHLLDAAAWFVELLQLAPRLKFLVTSREKLNTRWEWIVPLEGLDFLRADSPALQLFVERAQRVAPNFRVDDSNRADAARVCGFVDGMPLALELAAAAVSHHTCADIAAQLEHNLNFLETTLRDVPARQRSMRAVFDYSWNLLSEHERAVWRKLAVFHGGWTRDAARAIADAAATELNALVDKSLVRVLISAHATRYDMHELARQYAREKLKQHADEAAATRAKHSAYFAAYVAAHERALKGADDQNALSAITQELENVLAGWEQAWTGLDWQAIRAYIEPLLVVLEMRGQFALGAQLYQQARVRVELLRECPPEAAHMLGRLLIREGWMRFRLGEFSNTLELVQRGLPLLENARDEYDVAYGLLFMGAAAYGQGELEGSQNFFEQSYALYETIDNAWGCAGTLNNLGQIAIERGDDAAAENYLARALTIARTANISHLTAHTLNNLALLAMRQSDTKHAQEFLDEALDISKQRGEPHVTALTMSHLARALAHAEPMRARRVGESALAMFREFGDRSNMLDLLTLLGNLARAENENPHAANYFREAFTLAREIGASAQTIQEIADALKT